MTTTILPRTKGKRRQGEHQHQKALFAWARLRAGTMPELHLLHAIPNGGHRDIRVARKLKAEGVCSGVPDICLPVARRGYHGFYIELKAEGGRATEAQAGWIEALRRQGYFAVVREGWIEAQAEIEWYLGGV